jgi:hypothetical protein
VTVSLRGVGGRILRTVAKETPVTIHRNERVLAFMIAGIVGLSIVAIFVVLIGTGAGLSQAGPAALWQALTLFPFVGLMVGFLMIITLLVVSARRRSRETQAATSRSTSTTKK